VVASQEYSEWVVAEEPLVKEEQEVEVVAETVGKRATQSPLPIQKAAAKSKLAIGSSSSSSSSSNAISKKRPRPPATPPSAEDYSMAFATDADAAAAKTEDAGEEARLCCTLLTLEGPFGESLP